MNRSGLAGAIAAAVWVSACGGGGGTSSSPPPPPPPAPQNEAPIAKVAEDFTASLDAEGVEIDGSQSSDPDGDDLTYSWSITSQPDGATASFLPEDDAKPKMQAMVPGEYVLELTVTDPAGASGYDSLVVTLTNDAPIPMVEVSATMPALGEEIILSAAGSTDPNGHPLTYTWTVEESPPGSTLRASFDGASLPVQFDVTGNYVFKLEASDGYAVAETDVPVITASPFSISVMNTPFRYASTQPGGGLTVTVREKDLAILDENGVEAARLELPEIGTSVSVSASGLWAAVGHINMVTFIDLEARSIIGTWRSTADASDVVMFDDGHAAVFSNTYGIHAIETINAIHGGAVSRGWYTYYGARAKMHPSGTKAYAANNGLSPSDIFRVDISDEVASQSYDSPYHGDFPFCGNLWMSGDGATLLTKCGVVVYATEDPSTDMTYVMQLQGINGTIREASHSAYANVWYVLDYGAGAKVYDGQTGELIRVIELPRSEGETGSELYAKLLVASQSANSVAILSQDHETNPQRYYLVKSTVPESDVFDHPPELVVQDYSAGHANREVLIDASDSYDPEGMPLTFEWSLVSEPEISSVTPTGLTDSVLRFLPVVNGQYVFEVTASDGLRVSGPQRVTVLVSEDADPVVYRAKGVVTDAEYSKSLNLIAYVSDEAPVLHLLDLGDFSEKLVPLSRRAHRVGISFDEKFAAVSHPGMVSLVDLTSGTVIDTQHYSADWGDIVLDRNRRAHVVPYRNQWVNFISLDFTADEVSKAGGARARTQVRLHPNGEWVYGADQAFSPNDIEKWDVSTWPITRKGSSPYHGDYQFAGNIWISEDGDDLLATSGNLFNSTSDPAVDMTYLDRLPEGVYLEWADHSSETGIWAALVRTSTDTPSLIGKLAYYKDTTFERVGAQDILDVPLASGPVALTGERVFQSDSGEQMIVLGTVGSSYADPYFVQVYDAP